MSRYNTLYRDRRCSKAAIRPGTWPCDMTTVCHDTALGAATHAAVRDTARLHDLGAGCVAIQAATRSARPTTRPSTSHNTTRFGHDTAPMSAMTQPRAGHYTVPCARPGRYARALCAQPGFVGCAPNPVLTQCTVPCHCLGHCSLALFTRFSKKKKKNQIKSNQKKIE